MSVLEWMELNLLNLEPCADYKKIKRVISSQCNNASHRVFCDEVGWVHVFIRNWEPISFQAQSSAIKFCAITNENSLLVTLVQEDAKSVVLQVFNLNKITKRGGAPCMGTARLATMSPATALRVCILEMQKIYIAIGFECGDLFLHRATINRDMTSNFRSFTVFKQSIAGIEFISRSDSQFCNLFVCSQAGVYCLRLTDSNEINQNKIVLDNEAKPTRCCTVFTGGSEDSYFIVGRDDAVYFFTCDGRGPCYAIAGQKKCLALFGHNLVVVVQPQKTSSLPPPSSQLIIIDIHNKMIVLSKAVDSIASVLVENSNCYVLTASNDLFVVRERDIQSKLSLLVAKNLYSIALRLLENTDDERSTGQINMQYGDYLVSKGDLSGAVNKYIKTVGLVEPYYVIRKLLDSRYNKYLAEYLQALVLTEFATEEHLDLLFNCKERLELPSKIEHICRNREEEINVPDSSVTQASTHIIECGVVGDASLSAFLNLMHDSQRVCQFFSRFHEHKIYEFFMENGQWLITDDIRQITDILKLICGSGKNLINFPERFIPLLVAHNDCCIDFLEHVLTTNSKCNQIIYNFIFELYLRAWRNEKKNSEDLLEFLKANATNVCTKHILILCRNYSYWTGIVHMYKNFMQEIWCVRHFVKSSDFKNALANTDHFSDQSPQMLIQALSKGELMSDNSLKIFNDLLNALLEEKYQSLLQVLPSFSGNKNLLVQHIKEFFTQAHLHKIAGFQQQSEIVKKLCDDMKSYNCLLSNFSSSPIEFRNSICYICKELLKFPAVYYLCQHSFHKECLSAYSKSDGCYACMANKNQITEVSNCEGVKDDFALSNDIMESISTILGNGILSTGLFVNHAAVDKPTPTQESTTSRWPATESRKQWSGRFDTNKNSTQKNSLKGQTKSTNPFKNNENAVKEYDANLNPFEI